jgi:DeoR/GlpR family transcriptional regulator of sugar metabolism
MSRIARLIKLKELLDSGITEAKRLAARLGVKERTIYRDLKVLEEGTGEPASLVWHRRKRKKT